MVTEVYFLLGGPANSNMLSVRPDDKLTLVDLELPTPKPKTRKSEPKGRGLECGPLHQIVQARGTWLNCGQSAAPRT